MWHTEKGLDWVCSATSSALCQNYDCQLLQLKLLGRTLSIMIRVGWRGVEGGDQLIVESDVIIER